ncbi:MAG: YbaB/EbfC family nucleoid-associated protein [Firmicutes bacterium]|nr:YbaB/EbfC family nucleoid-associated protein [Bacillota bacterium]
MGRGMKAGKLPKQKTPDMQKQLRQAMQMQNEMEKVQAQLNEKELTTTAGGGAVEVTINGAQQLTKLVIDKDVVDPDDVEMLQDLIMAAVNESIRQMNAYAEEEMSKVTGGFGGFGGLGF